MYERERAALLREGRIIELGFRDLDGRPVDEVARIYRHFGWEGRERAVARVRDYVGTLRDFKKNAHRPLDEASAAVVREKWRESFETFGYAL